MDKTYYALVYGSKKARELLIGAGIVSYYVDAFLLTVVEIDPTYTRSSRLACIKGDKGLTWFIPRSALLPLNFRFSDIP